MAVESFRERLQHAIESLPEGTDFEQKLMMLHGAIRKAGVTGHHATRKTLRRWVDGRGVPPPYWVELAAGFLEVNPDWLNTGDGVMMAKGRKLPSGPPKGIDPPEKDEESVERARPPSASKKRREAQKKAMQETAAEKKKAAEPEPPKATGPKESEVSIPTAADVHATAAKTIYNFLAKAKSPEAVKAIRKYEKDNPTPRFKGGRKGILRAAEARLAVLTKEG